MSDGVARITKRNVVRFALTGFVGAWVAGCSADASRMSEGAPFSNPFASNTAAPTPQVAATPLASAAPANPDYVATAHPSPIVASALPASAPANTGQIHEPVGGSAKGWTAVGGSPIIVAQGDDLDGLSRRYGVPATALLTTNGLRTASEVRPGARLVVPVYSASARMAANDDHSSKSNHRETAEVDKPKLKKVAEAETSKSSKKSAKAKKGSDDADASDDVKAKVKSKKKQAEAEGTEKAEKTKTVASATPAKPAKPAAPIVAEADAAAKLSKKKTEPAQTSAVPATSAPATAQANVANAAPEFRWPARGRIIQGFKSGGNDGINIAVPEGTSVRAAEDGKVAYAGSALKGYGNLVLIRHPNGFVSAYANNGELDVKNGDTVKRGQVIAKSGQSGDVNSPQLHFELRKGSTPVDPTSYLAGL